MRRGESTRQKKKKGRRCQFFEAGGSAACRTDSGSSFRTSPAGITSMKTGVGGNSTTEVDDRPQNDWEKALDVMETEDPNKVRLCNELVLLVPSVWRRRAARRVISSKSELMDFLGA